MIASFGDRRTADLFHGAPTHRARSFPADVARVALRKLDMLNAAQALRDLRSPPGNRLEALRGARTGFYSIRINEQWRLVFRWSERTAEDVEILDYHKG